MKLVKITICICCILGTTKLFSQDIIIDKNRLEAVNVSMSIEKLLGKEVIRVIKDSTVKLVDEPTYVKIRGFEFKNGTIEVNVLSRLLPNAADSARGFIGIAFRINDRDTNFECIYIRPANGRDNHQIRRNHSIQYYSFPNYKFNSLRKEAPGEYESYADMGLNEWIKLRIIVNDAEAKLFLNDNKQPSLIVNDLKLGANSSGSIGLWVDVGTEGFFSDLKVYKNL
jgi:hypothetical protein